jgi:hypothetical protein
VAPRLARWGFVFWTFAQVGLASVFGVAAFFQPVIGRAFLDGGGDIAVAINEDVYAGRILMMVGVSSLLLVAGGIMLGIAANRRQMLRGGPGSPSPPRSRSSCSPSSYST